jgi:hypothetical protein
MDYESINQQLCQINTILPPLLKNFNMYFSENEGKQELINEIITTRTSKLLTNMNLFFDTNTMVSYIDKLYTYFLRNNRKIKDRLIFFEYILKLKVNSRKIYTLNSYKNFINVLFNENNIIDIEYLDKLINIVSADEDIYNTYSYLIYEYGYSLTNKPKSSNQDIYDISIYIENEKMMKKTMMYTLFIIKLYKTRKDDTELMELAKKLMDYNYFNFILESDIRKSELFITNELYSMSVRNNNIEESQWNKISYLQYKKNLLKRRIDQLNSIRGLLYEPDFEYFILDMIKSSDYYFEYLCYLYFKKEIKILSSQDIKYLVEIGEDTSVLMNDTIRDKYLSTIEYFSLTSKRYFNYNQENMIKSFNEDNDKWIKIICGLLENEYQDFDIIYDYKIIGILCLILSNRVYPKNDTVLEKIVYFMMNTYLKSDSFIEKDKIIELFNHIQEEEIYISEINFLTFIDFIEKYSYDYSSDIDINLLENKIVNIINSNTELFIKYTRGGYIDISLINQESDIHEAINNLNYERKELKYNPDHIDMISSLPIISFVNMPHNDKIFAEKYTIYRWLEFNSTNPFTNEDLTSIDLKHLNDTKEVKEICVSLHSDLFQ